VHHRQFHHRVRHGDQLLCLHRVLHSRRDAAERKELQSRLGADAERPGLQDAGVHAQAAARHAMKSWAVQVAVPTPDAEERPEAEASVQLLQAPALLRPELRELQELQLQVPLRRVCVAAKALPSVPRLQVLLLRALESAELQLVCGDGELQLLEPVWVPVQEFQELQYHDDGASRQAQEPKHARVFPSPIAHVHVRSGRR
jgi:hypothetical protein